MKIKRCTALFLVFAIMAFIPVSYAATMFTDIDESYWANEYITNVVERDIMTGFADATFKPEKPVSKLEVIIGLYNTVISARKFNNTQADVLVMKYTSQIEQANIPKVVEPYGDVVWKAVAFAMDNNILHQDELNGFVENGKLVDATKLETVIFMGKVMNLYLKEDLDRIVFFDYADAIKIPGQVAVYVDILIQHNIINKKGDKNKNFNPQSTISRATFATMISSVYNEIVGQVVTSRGNDNNEGSKDIMDLFPQSDKNYQGIVSNVHDELGVIEIRDLNGNLHAYDGNDAIYEKNGSKIDMSALKSGMDVFVYENGTKLSKVVVNKEFERIHGFLTAISDIINDKTGSYEIITITTDDGRKYYKLYDDAMVLRNGVLSKKSKLGIGDKVSASVDVFLVKNIEAYAENTVVEGVLNKDSSLKEGDVLSVKLMDGGYIDQIIDADVKVIGDDKIIKKGDIVNITLSYGRVSQIEDTGISSEITGIVQSILIADNAQMELDVKGMKKIINLNDNVDYVLSGDEKGSIYDLRLNQTVMVSIDMDGGKTISLSKPSETKKWSGKIDEVFAGANLLKVVDNSGRRWTVTVSDSAQVNLMKYKEGDMIFLVGRELSADVFAADLVVGQ